MKVVVCGAVLAIISCVMATLMLMVYTGVGLGYNMCYVGLRSTPSPGNLSRAGADGPPIPGPPDMTEPPEMIEPWSLLDFSEPPHRPDPPDLTEPPNPPDQPDMMTEPPNFPSSSDMIEPPHPPDPPDLTEPPNPLDRPDLTEPANFPSSTDLVDRVDAAEPPEFTEPPEHAAARRPAAPTTASWRLDSTPPTRTTSFIDFIRGKFMGANGDITATAGRRKIVMLGLTERATTTSEEAHRATVKPAQSSASLNKRVTRKRGKDGRLAPGAWTPAARPPSTLSRSLSTLLQPPSTLVPRWLQVLRRAEGHNGSSLL